MTLMPCLRAFATVGTIALVSLGTSRMPLAPAEIMLLIAVTWLALSPSYLPAAVISLTPACDAAFWAPSFIFTKNGLVSVFVISPTVMLPLLAVPPPDDVPPDELSLPHAATPATSSAAATAKAAVRDQTCPRRLTCM